MISAGLGKNVAVVVDVERGASIDPARNVGEGAPTRREARTARHAGQRAKTRARRELAAACLIVAAVPVALLISLWRNLTVSFWYNEQWRAFYISKSGDWWSTLKTDGGPFPAGWYFLERGSGWLFGSTELALRIPTAVFLPITCVLLLLLARRWMSLPGAVVLALVGGLTGTLVNFAVQLSEYQIDAAGVIAVLLLYELAASRGRSHWRDVPMWLAYAGIALACLFSTPAVFVAGPVLLLDVVRQARDRSMGARTAAAVAAGAIALAHIEFFVRRQNALTRSAYWDPNFLPRHGVRNQIAFVWDGLWGFVTGTLTGADNPKFPELLSLRWTWLISILFALLLCAGIATAASTRNGRTLLVAIGGSLGLTLVASYVRYWPFGFVRTNFYLVPLLILVAGIGAARVIRLLMGWLRPSDGAAAPVSDRWSAARWAAAVVAITALVAGVGLAATYEAGSYAQVRESASSPRIAALSYGESINTAVAAFKEQAKPGDALVVSGFMAIPGWKYYQDEYDGRSVPPARIDADHSYFTVDHGSSGITRLIVRTDPGHAFLYVPYGTPIPQIERDIDAIHAGGSCQPTGQMTNITYSGLFFRFACAGK